MAVPAGPWRYVPFERKFYCLRDPCSLESSYLCFVFTPFLPVTADDDGSGTTSILDAFRVLASTPTYAPTTSAVEFHWYSAEEGGLLGSQAVAKVYEEEGVDVKGMIQMDMTGTFWLLCLLPMAISSYAALGSSLGQKGYRGSRRCHHRLR